MNATTVLMANRDHVPGLGAKLRAAREAAQMTQVDAGQASGVHHVSIARYEVEERTPTLAALLKLAAAYGVDPCELLPAEADAPKRKPKKP